MDFHNIYAMQLYVICTKRGSGDDEMFLTLLKDFKVSYS